MRHNTLTSYPPYLILTTTTMSAPVDTTTAPATTNGAAPHIAEGTTTAPTTTTTAAEPATTSAPAATSAQANNGPINDKDINHWKTRVNDLIHTSGKSEAAVANPKPWHESVFGCFTPVDSCTCHPNTPKINPQTDKE